MGQRRAKDAVAFLSRLSPCPRSISSRLQLSTAAPPPVRLHARLLSHDACAGPRIGIVGGGLTGLTAAYYLARDLPATARITILEGGPRLGGWIKTDRVRVDVAGVQATVGFERGPRTLSSLHKSPWRFDDLVLYDLALGLGLPLSMPADLPRYIYYPDRLVALPPATTPARMLREPLFLDCLRAAAGFLWRRLRARPPPDDDLSVSAWLHSISGSPALADNIVSAMVHGVCGGDVDRISARSLLDSFFWTYHLADPGPHVKRMPAAEEALMTRLAADAAIRTLAMRPKGSLLHFGPAGMDSLPAALADALRGQPNVDIRLGEAVDAISRHDAGVEVSTAPHGRPPRIHIFDKVISTLPAPALAGAAAGLDVLTRIPAVSIMTVNLWYPRRNLKPPGTGYLIPRSVPPEQNPERALGVFFDSDVGAASAPDEPGTKLFVLMGGHHYDDGRVAVPSEDEAVAQAKTLLERHLGIPQSTPCFAMAALADRCIPQHNVGHRDLLRAARRHLRTGFRGRLAVAGGCYGRIGVMGALRGGYDVAATVLAEARAGRYAATGLEYLDADEFAEVPLAMIPRRLGKA